jgi:hypothetical protein
VISAKFEQSVTLKIFDIYSPTTFARGECHEVMLRPGWSTTNRRNLLSDFARQIVDLVRVPWLVLRASASRSGWKPAPKKSDSDQQAERETKPFFLSPPEEICGMVGTPNSLLD